MRRYLVCLFGIAALIALDRWVKNWTVTNIKDAADREFIPKLIKLTYVENRGAAFGILQNMRWMFVVLGVVVIIAIIWITFKERIQSPFMLAGVAFIIGGTIGNLVDRAFQGYVVDMFELEFMRFAIFNVADMALTCGGIILCLYIIVKKPI